MSLGERHVPAESLSEGTSIPLRPSSILFGFRIAGLLSPNPRIFLLDCPQIELSKNAIPLGKLSKDLLVLPTLVSHEQQRRTP